VSRLISGFKDDLRTRADMAAEPGQDYNDDGGTRPDSETLETILD
jgi:hypothetical protein